jgi:ribosome-associated protein
MTEADSYQLAKRIVEFSLTKKAQDVTLLDLKKLSSVCDYFIVCHGDSDAQVKAISNAIVDGMKGEGARVWHREGFDYLRWVLLDYVDVVVHVFQKEAREFYRLEKLWGDAGVENFGE